MCSQCDSESEALRTVDEVVWSVYRRAVVRQVVLASIPIVASLAAGVWLLVCVFLATADVPTWLFLVALVVMMPGWVAGFVHLRREFSGPRRRAPRPPVLFDREGAVGWVLLLSGLPLIAIAAYHLIITGWSAVAAVGVSLLGWLGFDLAQIVSFPARRTFYRLRMLTESTTVPGT